MQVYTATPHNVLCHIIIVMICSVLGQDLSYCCNLQSGLLLPTDCKAVAPPTLWKGSCMKSGQNEMCLGLLLEYYDSIVVEINENCIS